MQRVIFACVHNAGRSQMARAFFEEMADPAKASAVSAGTEPGKQVHPEVLVEGKGLGVRIPELTDALLFVELEGKKDKFHVGYWLSVYDEAQAKALEAPAKRAFQRIHESLPA